MRQRTFVCRHRDYENLGKIRYHFACKILFVVSVKDTKHQGTKISNNRQDKARYSDSNEET